MLFFSSGTATAKIGLTYGVDRYLDYTTYYRMLATGFRRDARFCGVTRKSLVSRGKRRFILEGTVTLCPLPMLWSTDRPGHKHFSPKFVLNVVVTVGLTQRSVTERNENRKPNKIQS
jgi:hypothetical protein